MVEYAILTAVCFSYLLGTMCSSNVVQRINRAMRRKFDGMAACRGAQAVTRTAALVAMKLSDDLRNTVVRRLKKARKYVRSVA